MEKEYKIDSDVQLDKALKYLDTLGYEWNSGRGLTEWKPNAHYDHFNFPIVLVTGITDKPNQVVYRRLGVGGITCPPPFDNLLDAPDYSKGGVEECGLEEIDTEEGQTADEIFGEFLRELSELLGLTEDEELETDDMPDKDGLPKDGEISEEKVTKYTVRLTNGENIYIKKYSGTCNSDFFINRGDTDKLTAKELFMYLTGEEVEAGVFMNGKWDIRHGLGMIKTIEVDGTHKAGEFKSGVRFAVIADGKHVTIDRFSVLNNDYHLFESPDIYDGNELTFDELLAFITGKGDVDKRDSFKEIQSISVVTPDKEYEETFYSTLDAPDRTKEEDVKFIIHMVDGEVVWRVNGNHGEYKGADGSYKIEDVDTFFITSEWYYELTFDQVSEVFGLIDISGLDNIEVIQP